MPDGSRLEAPDSIVTLPNMISFGRLCAVPLLIWLVLREDLRAAFWTFLAAGLSDALDGWLARRGKGSRLGAALDPVADKVLLTSMSVVLASVRLLPDWLALVIVFRDLLIVGGIGLMIAVGRSVLIAPLWISKLNTALQIALVTVVLLIAAYALARPAALDWLIAAVMGTTCASGALYVYKAARD